MNVRTGNFFDEESNVFPIDQIRKVDRNHTDSEDDFELQVTLKDGLVVFCDYVVFE